MPCGGWHGIATVACRSAFPKPDQSLQPFRALIKNKDSRDLPQTYPNRICILEKLLHVILGYTAKDDRRRVRRQNAGPRLR